MRRCRRALVTHAYHAAQQKKARSFSDDIRRLIQKLSDILGADFARSEAGRSTENLKASVGAVHAEVFDFAAMSRVLKKASPGAALPPAPARTHTLAADDARSAEILSGSGPFRRGGAMLIHSCSTAASARWPPTASASPG